MDGVRTFSVHPILLMTSSLEGRDGTRGEFKGGGVDKKMKFEVPKLSCAQKFLGQKY